MGAEKANQLTEDTGINSPWFHDIEANSVRITAMCNELRYALQGKARGLIGFQGLDDCEQKKDTVEPRSWAERVVTDQNAQTKALEEALEVLKSI